jgi:hypothetical protein
MKPVKREYNAGSTDARAAENRKFSPYSIYEIRQKRGKKTLLQEKIVPPFELQMRNVNVE